MTIGTLQCESQQPEIHTMTEIPTNVVSPSVTLFNKELKLKEQDLFYIFKKVLRITKLPFCTEEVLVLIEGQNFSSIRYLDPLTNVVFHNFTIAACKLLYQNVFKLEEASFQQFKAIYQLPMNLNLNVSAQNLHRRFFFTSDIKEKQIA